MDEKELQKEEFSLEDILREFGITPTENPVDDDVQIWDGVIPEPAQEEPPRDTVRLDEITKAVRELEQTTQETARFTPVGGDAEVLPDPVLPVQDEPQVEPFSAQWEPEYEQPIGEYVPPQPIVFRPKSRLRELKRKLVEGPERRYYELEEIGVGKLQIAIFFSLLVTLVAIGTAVLYQFGLVSAERTRLMIFGQVFLLLLSGLLGSYQLLDGLAGLFKGRFGLNTLLVFCFLACCADGILCLQSQRISCCGVFSLHITMSLISTYHKRTAELAQMDTMRKATVLDALVLRPDSYEGRPAYLRAQGEVEDFMDNYAVPSGPEKTTGIYALIALVLSIGCGVAALVLYGLEQGVQIFAVALLVAVPASMHTSLSKPAALLQRRLRKHGSVICGWKGVVGLCRSAVFPLTDSDLFPTGSAKLNGVKFYGSREPDEVVSYAAALIGADGGSMAPLVSHLLESRSGYHYDVEQLQSYPGGIGGVINDEAVLAGSLAFMQSMGVDMPKGTKVSQAVYVAVDGELSGVFAVSYSKVKSSAVGLTTLCAYRRLTPVLISSDFMLTESFLRGKFGVNTRRIAFPDRQTRKELAGLQAQETDEALALMTKDGLAGMAYAVTGARALRSSCIAGTVVHIFGGVLGLAIVAALVAVGAEHLLTPYNLLLLQALWLIPGWLIGEWTRSV